MTLLLYFVAVAMRDPRVSALFVHRAGPARGNHFSMPTNDMQEGIPLSY